MKVGDVREILTFCQHRKESMGPEARRQRTDDSRQRAAKASRHLPSASLSHYATLSSGIALDFSG